MAVGMGVADLELGEGLSPAVQGALPAVVATVVQLVSARQRERGQGWRC
jgi:hypothetical protein